MKKYKEINLAIAPKMTFSDSFLRNVKTLHEKVGKVEWSGFLLCHMDGTLEDLANLKTHVVDVYPCNIGNPSFTEYASGDHYEEMSDIFSDFDMFSKQRWDGKTVTSGYKVQQIHTHHAMETFFSGTDMADLHDNTENFGLYISLIVNLSGVWKAKGSFMAETETKTLINCSDFPVNLQTKEKTKSLVIFDLNLDMQVPEWLTSKITKMNVFALANAASKKSTYFVPRGEKTPVRSAKDSKINYLFDEVPSHTSKFVPGFGNIYTDETGRHHTDAGEILNQSDYETIMDMLS